MDGARFGTRLDIPKVGEHTREVLAGLGYDAATIARYAAENIIFIK
jgi:crotonobetainyl-CoA:carnitine CoA-transferase CaiB-like acyl-CoA transferase